MLGAILADMFVRRAIYICLILEFGLAYIAMTDLVLAAFAA